MTLDDQLPSRAERQAKRAEALSAFRGLNLLHIRRQVILLLDLIGREGIFDQYTTHNISHIDKMLASLDWLIPDTTQAIMSPSDWLMTVLAIYFHDMGMLVTAREFDNRDQTDFPRFKTETLFGGPSGTDYKAKVKTLPADRAERFLYQEFVRSTHAERIRLWVTGKIKDALGVSHEIVAAMDELLNPIGEQFRRDLGLVCESHHLNDLDNRKKYKTAEPYGDSDLATANIQYCAVLLRTADLLHITADRTPSITFKVINPSDPISQQEWAKQAAVRRVHPKVGMNDEGQPDEKAPKDTIQVHAYFSNQDGFFGLTTYLAYCAEQLRLSHQWIANARKEGLVRHEFPWRKIDDSNIQTVGFIRDTFEFAIDQARILDLLTGHTLYNDTRVVLRELVQNSLDAIRIQNYPKPSADLGKIAIDWNSKTRILSVTDNGTGMTQEFITKFLLKVGTSRYQDPEFRKEHPGFSSISRFGIGVLSTFMIADSVEVLTCHPENEEARQLTLRSVHGKYLIRLLEKESPEVKPVFPHGTSFALRVRPSVKMGDVLMTAQTWIVIPGCDVYVTVDGEAPVKIGFRSPGEAVAGLLAATGARADIVSELDTPSGHHARPPIKVVEKVVDGVALAYAVQWNEYFREWAFLSADQYQYRPSRNRPSFLGTCIEGIRVEFQSPGYAAPTIVAIANVTGTDAPKTNVARSGIEATQERDYMLRRVYRLYRNHLADELEQLQKVRSYSLTWALEEARYLIAPLMPNPTSKALLDEELAQLPALPVEQNLSRSAISPADLVKHSHFWTIECTLLQPAEALIREAPTSVSLSELVRAMKLPDFEFPTEPVLCGVRPSTTFGEFAYSNREVDKVFVNRKQRRIDLRWAEKTTPPRWLSLPDQVPEVLTRLVRGRGDVSLTSIYVGNRKIEVAGELEPALITLDRIFLMPSTPAAQFLQPWLEKLAEPQPLQYQIAAAFNVHVIRECLRFTGKVPDPEKLVANSLSAWENDVGALLRIDSECQPQALTQFIAQSTWGAFAPSAWSRKWTTN